MDCPTLDEKNDYTFWLSLGKIRICRGRWILLTLKRIRHV